MTRFQFILAGFAAALFTVPMLAGHANASVTGQLGNCKYDSKQKTVQCCDQVIRKAKTLPYWWPTENRSCNSAGLIKCVGGKAPTPVTQAIAYVAPKKKLCWVEIPAAGGNGGKSSGGNLPPAGGNSGGNFKP